MKKRLEILVKNTLSNFGLLLVTLVLGVLVVPVMISSVGEEGYGLLALATTILGYFSVMGLGIPAGTIKYVAEYDGAGDQEMVDRIINTSLAFYLGIGILAGTLIWGFTYFGGLDFFNITDVNRAPARRLMYVAAGFSVISWPAGILPQVLSGLQRYHRKNVITASTNALGLLAAIIAAKAGASLVEIFLAQRGGTLVGWALMYREVRRSVPSWQFSLGAADRSTLKMIFSLSVWMLLGQISMLLIYQTDKIIIGAALPIAMLTVYEIVLKPKDLVKSFAGQFRSAVMPAVSSLSKEASDAHEQFIYIGSRYSNLFTSVFAVGALVFAEPFIRLWVGEKYVQYAWIAQVACGFQLIWLSNGFLGQIFQGRGYVMRLGVIALASAILNVSLSIWWVDVFGFAGVILATVASGVLTVPVQYAWLLPVLDIDRPRYLWESVVNPQLPAVAAGAATIPLWSAIQSLDSWWKLASGVLLMGAVMALSGWCLIIEPAHRRTILRWIRRGLDDS